MLVPQSTDANAEESEVLVVTWHSCRDFLACANCFSNDIGVVKFYSKQGGKLLYTSKEKTAAKPVQILWHPTEAVVVVGWDSGKVSLISPTNDVEADIPGVELSSIVGMAWDETANEILIADSEGRLATFQIDCNDLKKSSFKTKATLRDDRAVSIVLKKVKQKPSTASNPNRKLAKQETVNENDEEIFNAIAETKRHTNVASDETSVFVRDTTQYTGIFYIGTASGAIHAMDPDRILTKVFQCDTTVIQVLNLPETDLLFATTESMFFYQLIAESKSLQEKLRIKLTGKKNYFRMVMVDGFTVAVSYGEREIRVWDIRANDNSLFRLQTDKGYGSNDFIVCLAYSTKKNHISAGTIEGKIVRWKRRRDEETVDRQWLLQSAIETGANIRSIDWSPVTAALVVNAVHHVNIFQDEGNLFHFSFPYGVIWKKPQVLSLARLYPPHEAQDINLPFIVKGFRIATTLLTIWEETEIHIYEIKDCNDQPLNITTIASFSCSAKDAYVLGAVVVVLTVENKLEARTFQGTVRQTINFREVEGLPIMLDFSGKFMVVATSGGYLSIFDLTSRDLKPTFHSSQFSQTIPDFNRFLRVKVNSTGTRISFTVTLKNDEVYEKISFWDAETDYIGYFSFKQGITDQQQYETEAEQLKPGERPKTTATRKIEREQSRYQLPFHSPGCHHFDRSDPRLVICEAIHNGGDASQNFLISMFVTMEHGVQMQDIQPKSERADQLLFVAVPHLYFIKNTDISDTGDSPMETSIGLLLLRKTMREFIGLDENDDKAVEAMVNFSYYLCLGQMDNAFKSMKFIKNDSVWDHMARMCVKTRRIDVARVCLGNMHNARAARNIRLSVERGESVDMQAAQLAIELGMLDEARSIYQSIGRFDNLNKLYQSELKWNEAFAVAEKQDRVSLRNTFFNYAKYLEENGAIEAAIDNYHSSGVGEFNIPRMLFANPKSLESYVKRVRDPKFHVWWARYLESYGDITTAKNFYKIADDHFDLVRLLCMEDQMDEAEEIVSKTDSPLAAFHMAQQYEHRGEVDKAVNYFSKAKAYGSAIRLAKENDMVDKLANLALQAGGKCLTEAAVFYEDRPGYADKAVMLYHKAGLIGRALDLAFKTDQQSSLDLIVQELDEKSDPRTLERAAQFFANNQQDRKAIQLLAYAKKYQEAINLCRERNVVVTEELAELLTPPKGEASTNAARNALLTEVAKCCQHQGNYHFAAKKFTQAGNKIEAMRALLKSGDTPKIVLFTNTARNKDIYRMAGNYLQTLAWHDDVDVMKNIETFYIKGEALDSLASFYKACAALEIEEFRDYEKGMRAMEASLKAINNKITKEGGEQKSLNFREEVTEIMKNIQRFLRAKELYKTDVGEALREFQALLEVPGIEESVRRGDLYAILIMHNAKRQNFDKAYQIMQECLSKKPRIDIRKFMNTELLDQICDRTGNPRITVAATTAGGSDDEIDGGVDFSHAMQRRMSEEGGMSDSDNDF